MKINIDNYELFAMDYLEGNLDAMKEKEMISFLVLHPHIAEELHDVNQVILSSELHNKLGSKFTNTLKKELVIETSPINEDNYEEYFIAYLEGDIKEKDAETLSAFLNINAHLSKEFQKQQTTKLKPDHAIVFDDKASLKKSETKLYILWPAIASIAAMLFISFWVWKPNTIQRNQLLINPVNFKQTASLFIDYQQVNLQKEMQLHVLEYFEEELVNTAQQGVIKEAGAISKISPKENRIPIVRNNWQNEIILMQSMALSRNELFSKNDFTKTKTGKKPSTFRLISSLFWKTTKGQIKNISEEIIHEDLKTWQADKMEALTSGFISVKSKSKE